MPTIRPETRVRARALQLLYASDVQHGAEVSTIADRLLALGRGRLDEGERAASLATAVVRDRDRLDAEIEPTIEGWQYSRVGLVEKNILRLALHELRHTDTPAKVVIDEALRLAHWFGGERSHQLINGVLDTLARREGRL